MGLGHFNQLWGSEDYPPEPVSGEAFVQAETALGFRFPMDYRQSVLDIGLPRTTIALLHSVVEQDIDLSVVNDFLKPAEVVETTQSWRELGLPDDLVAFATDCSGNLFCFPTAQSERPSGSVWLWDHDFDDTNEVADSFEDWVSDMCLIERVEDDED